MCSHVVVLGLSVRSVLVPYVVGAEDAVTVMPVLLFCVGCEYACVCG